MTRKRITLEHLLLRQPGAFNITHGTEVIYTEPRYHSAGTRPVSLFAVLHVAYNRFFQEGAVTAQLLVAHPLPKETRALHQRLALKLARRAICAPGVR